MNQIAIIIICLLFFGAVPFFLREREKVRVYNIQSEQGPEIEIIGEPEIDKIDFKFSVDGFEYIGTMAFGEIISKSINGYFFEATSQNYVNHIDNTYDIGIKQMFESQRKVVFTVRNLIGMTIRYKEILIK